MSELKEYIDESINSKYEFVKTMSETAIINLSLYKHKLTDNKIILIKSSYRNDEVYRTLKGLDTQGYLPMIYEVCSEDDYLYVLEEYIDGKSLADVMQGNDKLDINDIKNYLIDLCSALDILHKLNIIHRDIKPDNIIIHNDRAYLIDLSISKMVSSGRDNDTTNLGTIGYAAPEQYGFSQSQPTTDIYALGVLANELILGVHPTVAIPKGRIGKIIKRCTETQISKRYQDVNTLKKDIKRA